MPDIGAWSFARVALVSVLWVALNIALPVGVIYLWVRSSRSSGSGGIGAVVADTLSSPSLFSTCSVLRSC